MVEDSNTSIDRTEYSYTAPQPTRGEVIGLSLLGAALVGLFGFLVKNEMQDDRRREAERKEREEEREAEKKARNDWLDSQRNQGRIILNLNNGDFASVPAEMYKEFTFRKP